MMAALHAVGDVAGALGWHAWQASAAGLAALGLAAIVRSRAPRTAAVLVSLALVKFLAPPLVRSPFALGDAAAMMINPFAFMPPAQSALSWRGGLLVIATFVTLGMGAALAARVARHARMVRRVRRSAEPAAGAALDAFRETAARLRLTIAPRLLISDDVDGPFATGVWRPAVILPRAALRRLDPGTLRVVLAHELVHHRRRDLPMAWCAAIATSLFWFSPITWRLARTLRELREECCDAEVIARGFATPEGYAAALLDAASVPSGLAALPMRDAHPLGRRLRRVLESPPPLPAFATLLVVTLFAVLCLPATPFSPPWPSRDGVVHVIRIVR